MSLKSQQRKHLRNRFRRRAKPGASPGTLIVDPAAPKPVIDVIAYGPGDVKEQLNIGVDKIPARASAFPVTWINVTGLGDLATIQKLGQMFQLHRLALEDVVNVHQRAKVDQYGDYLFIVARTIECSEPLQTEQISIFLGPNYVLTFQERPGDNWDPVRKRIREKQGRIRDAGPDYLTYALLDAVVDSYFPALDRLGERVEQLDEQLTLDANRAAMAHIHDIRGDLHLLRRSIWPHREALSALTRESHSLVTNETRIYLRDCYDHTIQIIDLVETNRDLCSDLRDFYLSAVSNRMNEIMKVLTIIATFFMPLTFIVGVYGMNFNPSSSPWNMPELNWRYGYPATWGLMLAVTAVMLWFFWRRGWLRR